ncbi:MAG: F0F1 ATP synthase subunit gamma, partial [Candidatus Acidiferrales bacterium]
MPTLLDFRRRIRSVKNTQQITRAMKFIAAARLRKAQEGVMAARPYAREILRILRSAVTRIEEPMHPLLERRPEESILVIVMTGDRGLAGPFNANVLRYATTFLREQASKKIRVMAIGK